MRDMYGDVMFRFWNVGERGGHGNMRYVLPIIVLESWTAWGAYSTGAGWKGNA